MGVTDDNSYTDDLGLARLIWDKDEPEDKEDIRVGMQALFESLKSNRLLLRPGGATLHLEGANVSAGKTMYRGAMDFTNNTQHSENFDTDECLVCGRSASVQCKDISDSGPRLW